MTATPPADAAPRAVALGVVLRASLPPTAVVGIVASVVLAVVRGVDGGVSALVGVVIAVVFFASGLLVMARVVTDTGNPLLFMAVGMATYFGQVLALFGLLLLAGRIEVFDSQAAGVAILCCLVAWQFAQMRAWRRARLPLYDDVRLPDPRPSDHVTGSTS